jgi:hypothetical protein
MSPVRGCIPEGVATPDRGVQLVFSRDGICPEPGASYRVQFHNKLEAFTIYPRNDRDLVVNELIWHSVKDSSFRSDAWPTRPGAAEHAHAIGDQARLKHGNATAVFALGIPDQLVKYLQSVTLDEMHDSILCMLADAARSEDESGLQLMENDLAPSMWDDLTFLLREGQTQRQRKRQKNVPQPVSLLASSSETYATNYSSGAGPLPTALTSNMLWRGQESCMFASYLLDQALHSAKEHNYWQIPITGATFELATEQATAHDNDQAIVLHSLHSDFHLYLTNCMIAPKPPVSATTSNRGTKRSASPLVPTLGSGAVDHLHGESIDTSRRTHIERRQVFSTTMTLVQERHQSETRARAATVLSCTKRPDSYFASLPHHVVQHYILTKVVLEELCPAEADAKSVAIFQTIDMSPAKKPQ